MSMSTAEKTQSTQQMAATRASWKGWVLPVIAAGLLAASIATLASTNAQIADASAERAETMLALNERIEVLATVRADATESAVALAAGAPSGDLGLVMERLAADEEAIGKLLTVIFAWDSTDSYEVAREHLTRVYGIQPDSAFMATFLPPAPVSVDADGLEYNYIEAARLNSALSAFTVKPILVHGGQYQYLVMASVISKSNDGSSTASRGVVLTLTTSVDGSISDLQGWASPKEARVAG